jgi:MurNAc alpha-1-phosphate uridylyltransferase
MKAMILAAGKGERMRPLTEVTPKPLLRVDGQPLIIYHLKALAKIGITNIVINTHHLGEQLVSALSDGGSFGVSISYSHEQELLNTGGGIVKALPLLGPDPFLVISADILSDFPLQTLPTVPSSLAHLVMVDNPSYHLNGDFALDRGRLSLSGTAKYTYGNIGVFRPEFFAGCPAGAFALGDLLRQRIADNLVTGQYYAGSWHNIGTPADLELANSAL